MTLGILNDKWTSEAGRVFAKINNKPFEVTGYVIAELDDIEKGSTVDYTETNDIIRKIAGRKKPVTKPVPVQTMFTNGKNEKLIVMQHNITMVSDLFIASNPFENFSFEESLDRIYEKAKEITERMMRDCHD